VTELWGLFQVALGTLFGVIVAVAFIILTTAVIITAFCMALVIVTAVISIPGIVIFFTLRILGVV